MWCGEARRWVWHVCDGGCGAIVDAVTTGNVNAEEGRDVVGSGRAMCGCELDIVRYWSFA